jgi:hypothetical protein
MVRMGGPQKEWTKGRSSDLNLGPISKFACRERGKQEKYFRIFGLLVTILTSDLDTMRGARMLTTLS